MSKEDRMMKAIKEELGEKDDEDSNDEEEDLQMKKLMDKANVKSTTKPITSPIATWVDVPTQTTPMIKLENGDIVSSAELQVIDHNLLLKIIKSVA